MQYPARFEHDESGGYTVTFRDIPEAITQGDDLEEARAAAADALLTAMDFYIEDERAVPAPSAARRGEELVSLPPSAWAKVQLLNVMVDEKVRPADLARKLHTTRQEVNRIIDLHHTTKIDTIAEAVAALGRRLVVQVL
jgi:antitoxin HicB